MKIKELLIIVFWASLCIVTSQSPLLACVVAIPQHLILLFYLVTKKYYSAFKVMLLFTTVSLEMADFVVGKGGTTYSFFSIPIVHGLLGVFEMCWLCAAVIRSNRKIPSDTNGHFFHKWLIIMTIAALITPIITFITNDNGTTASGFYPKVTLLRIISFADRFCLFEITLYFIYVLDKSKEVSSYCLNLLLGLVLSSIPLAIIGFKGYYGDEFTMLSSLAMGFTPCLLLLNNKKYSTSYNVLILFCGITTIVSSFLYPSVIGSKWYLVILFVMVCLLFKYSGIKSATAFIALGVGSLFLIPYIVEFILDNFARDSYIASKLNQSLAVLNFASSLSFDDYVNSVGKSPLFRLDEVHNIFIEYMQKPFYAFFGKGFGGTTLHYTDLLSWDTSEGAFSDDQIKMHAYYAMHETIAEVFLTHGFIGLSVVVVLLIRLLKSIRVSDWSALGFLFLFFYWGYGSSLSVGAVAMILTMYEIDKKQIYGRN